MKKSLTGIILFFWLAATQAQDLPVSGFVKKKAAEKEKKAYKRNVSLKSNIPLYGLIPSRLGKIPAKKSIFFTPITTHNNLFKPLNKINYYQYIRFETFTKPIFLRLN